MLGQLGAVARAARGGGRTLVGVERLRGGSRKGVYRLGFDDDSTAIAYIWSDGESHRPSAGELSAGIEPFEAATRCLSDLGVRTPRVHLTDRTGKYFPADIAVVEDVPGANLEDLLRDDPGLAAPALDRLAAALGVMREHTAPGFGGIAEAGRPGSCVADVLGRAEGDLAEAAARDVRIAVVEDRLAEVLHGLAGAVRPRSEHRLIHGELGPDHVLVDRDGLPVLIDIEGLMFFDVEWEHAFLRIRFGAHYERLACGGLDERRLDFYGLAMRLSLVAGPLRLLDGDFPDREFMTGVVEHNLRETLLYLQAPRM